MKKLEASIYNKLIFYLKCLEFRWTSTAKDKILFLLVTTKVSIPEVLLIIPLELSATVDEQKRVIRKLNLKITKLEEALKK